MPEKFVDRFCGFIYLDKTTNGNDKLSIVFNNIKDIGQVRLFALPSKKSPKVYKIYRLDGKNKDLFLKSLPKEDQ